MITYCSTAHYKMTIADHVADGPLNDNMYDDLQAQRKTAFFATATFPSMGNDNKHDMYANISNS